MNILHLLCTDGFISVNKNLIKKVGLESAVLIGELSSEFIYHSDKGYLTEDGYFFSTVKNIEEKTRIKEKRQRAILKELEEMGIIDTVKRGLPSKRYIKINQNNLLNLISIPNKNGQNGGTVTVHKAELIPSVEATNNNIINNKIINNKDNVPAKADTIPYKYIVDYLNLKSGKNFKSTSKETKTLIKSRFNDGFTEHDFIKVIDNKVKGWLNDEQMDKYIRPKTLFGTKFESYLNENVINKKEKTDVFDLISGNGDEYNERETNRGIIESNSGYLSEPVSKKSRTSEYIEATILDFIEE